MTSRHHRQALGFVFGLYFLATWTSMAGMEIFGWLTFALVVTYFFRSRPAAEPQFSEILKRIPWKTCLILLVWTAAGLYVHRTEKTEFLQHFGSQRWMFILLSSSLALSLFPPTLRGYRVFLILTSVIAAYALFQSVTGVDLLRPGSHRAVQPLGSETDPSRLPLWRSAGPFGSPLGYAYIAGQYVCVMLAVALLTFKVRGYRPLFWASLGAYILVSASLITTFTRGVWIATTISHLLMAWAVSKVLAGAFLGTAVLAVAGLFSFVETFRQRILTLFDPKYASNSERMFLWRANWEMFKDYPILGIGYQENENRAGEYVARLGHPDAFTGHAHSNYIQMLSGTGIVGFGLYLFISGFMLWLNWRLWTRLKKAPLWPRALTLGCLGAQITLHIGGFTECNFKAGATSHNTMMAWGLVAALSVLAERNFFDQGTHEITRA